MGGKLTPAQVDEVWVRWRSGQAVKVLSRQMRVNPSTVRDLLHRTGGIRPAPRRRWELRLSFAEREEISRGLAAGLSIRMIAVGLGRSPSTVSREVLANGGRSRYRAASADQAAWSRAVRPKPTKLASRVALTDLVALPSSSWTGHRSRSRVGSRSSSLTMRRCRCRTSRSTDHCSCRPAAACVRNSRHTCAPNELPVALQEHANRTGADCVRTSSTSLNDPPR